MSTLSTADIYAIAGGMIGALLALMLVFYVLLVIAEWKMFNKMGEPGWKSIIPFYNQYILFKKTWKTSWFWALFSCTVGYTAIAETCASDNPLQILAFVCIVIVVVILIISYYHLVVSFGHGAGFVVFMVFLPNIALLYLGFSKDEYIGNLTDGNSAN